MKILSALCEMQRSRYNIIELFLFIFRDILEKEFIFVLFFFQDNELLELIVEVRQCISLLGPTHKLFVEVLLNINWTSRSPEATTAYKGLLEDLVCVHIYHCKFVMDKLVSQFRPSEFIFIYLMYLLYSIYLRVCKTINKYLPLKNFLLEKFQCQTVKQSGKMAR